MAVFTRRSRLDAPLDAVFGWHERPGAFQRLAPPWQTVKLIKCEGIHDGTQSEFELRVGPLRRRWLAEHSDYQIGRRFRDVQLSGPFAAWQHTHSFEADGPEACILDDRIEYRLPMGVIGELIAGRYCRRQLERAFAYRHRVTQNDVVMHQKYGGTDSMRVLVSGSHGLIGSVLVPFLTGGGHDVSRLMRTQPDEGSINIAWDPSAGTIDGSALNGFDAVVHLAGDNIAEGRWNAAKKKRIRDSRVNGTRLLCETLAKLQKPPKVVVCASAIGFYGDRGDELLDENSAAGTSFLCDVCREWEQSAQPAIEAGIRVVNLRFGVVLTPAGGALAKLLFPFKMCVGGVVGNGRQFWSWIAIDDVVGAILHALATDALEGPVNCVAPKPVTNREFTKTLGRILKRPTILPMPAFAARLALGEMADELLLASANVSPAKLMGTGYEFLFSDLEPAIRHVLGRINSLA